MVEKVLQSLSVGDKNGAVTGAALLSSGEAALDSRSASLPSSGASSVPVPPYTGAPFSCALDELEIADYWFTTPKGDWLWGGWEPLQAARRVSVVFPDRDRILCPWGFDPNVLLPKEKN